MDELMNDAWTDEWINELKNVRMNACMNEWMNEWENEWVNEWNSGVKSGVKFWAKKNKNSQLGIPNFELIIIIIILLIVVQLYRYYFWMYIIKHSCIAVQLQKKAFIKAFMKGYCLRSRCLDLRPARPAAWICRSCGTGSRSEGSALQGRN